MSKLTVEQVEDMAHRIEMEIFDLGDVHTLRDLALLGLASVRDAEPVAEVVQREPYVDGTTNAHHELNWRLYNCENALPVGTKLYLHPTAQPSADELLREANAFIASIQFRLTGTPSFTKGLNLMERIDAHLTARSAT